jgi:hypothetical protein
VIGLALARIDLHTKRASQGGWQVDDVCGRTSGVGHEFPAKAAQGEAVSTSIPPTDFSKIVYLVMTITCNWLQVV